MSTVNWQEEERRAERTLRSIELRLGGLEEEVSGIREEVVGIRRQFWDDVSINLDNAESIIDTYASLKQQAEVLSGRERAHRQSVKQLGILRKLMRSPYFGRVDFAEKGFGVPEESIYLGIASFVADDGIDYLIYDWRAPISGLYYDYEPGPARYETPSGTIEGEMQLKRQYVFRDGHLATMFDSGVTIGDELLMEALGRQSDAQMRSIVATIQREQNRIIRNESAKLLVVTGPAGSGKTSAALQRVAYLLYRNRDSLKADQIVLFSPNPMFNSYVSTVLPELGEENMQQTTYQEYLDYRLAGSFELEDQFDQTEALLGSDGGEAGSSARQAGIRFKAGLGFLKLLDAYAVRLRREGLRFADLEFQGEAMTDAAAMSRFVYAKDDAWPVPNRLLALKEELLKELNRKARTELDKPWVEDAVELLDNDAYIEAYSKLYQDKEFSENTFDDYGREKQALAAMVVRERMEPLRKWVKELRFLDVPAVYRQLFADPKLARELVPVGTLPAEWEHICAQTVSELERGRMAYEDTTPYLYLKDCLEGFPANTHVRHVFIDEGQDYAVIQLAYLKRLFPRSGMTVLGDPNQAVLAYAAAGDTLAVVPELFGGEATETVALRRTYRSTRPIMEFAQRVLPPDQSAEPFERGGPEPTVSLAGNMEELADSVTARVQALLAAGRNTVAVIVKSMEECRAVYEALKPRLPAVRLIDKDASGFAAGAVVLPVYLAKGVEFDAVVVYDASAARYPGESDRKLLYTACTRAMHELHVFSLGELSPLLAR